MLVRALAAAVLGPHGRLPAHRGGRRSGSAIVEQAIVFDTGRDLYVFPVLFVIIVVGLLLEPRGSAAAGSTTKPCRPGRPRARCGPIPTELRSIPEVRWARRPRAVALVVAVRPDAPAAGCRTASS